MRPEDVEVMIRRLRRARAIVRGEEPDDGDPALRAVLAVLTRDPNALDGLSEAAPDLLWRARALSGPGPERDALMRWRPPKRERPRCGAETKRGPCSAPVTCERDFAGRIVMGDRCTRHATAPRVTAGTRRDSRP